MDKKYCDQCGQELDVSAQFCSSCGAKTSSLEKETVGAKVDKIIDKTKSNSGGIFNVKLLLAGIIVLLVILILVFAFSGGNNISLGSDAVDVTSVTLDHKYFYATTVSGGTSDNRPIKGIIKFTGLDQQPKGICKDSDNGTRKAWNMEGLLPKKY